MSLFLFIVLVFTGLVSLVGTIDYVRAVIGEVKAKNGWRIAAQAVVFALSIVVGVGLAGDIWSALGVIALALAVIHLSALVIEKWITDWRARHGKLV